MSKYNYNKDYFLKIDSSEKAYWLGFLYADGCITRYYRNEKLKSMSLELTLCKEDYNHLCKLNKCLSSNVPIKSKIVRTNQHEYEESKLVINCTKLCYDLINLGCTPNKTFSIELPDDFKVPDIYKRDFIRGFFDGDGCICITTMSGKPHISVSITGIEKMLDSIINYLISNGVIRINPKKYIKDNEKVKSFYLYGNMAKDFLDYIYKDASVYLDRKYKKYKDFYKDYSDIDYRGVHWSAENQAYIVTICINEKKRRIGQSRDLNKAISMRKEAEYEKMKSKETAH